MIPPARPKGSSLALPNFANNFCAKGRLKIADGPRIQANAKPKITRISASSECHACRTSRRLHRPKPRAPALQRLVIQP